MSVAAGNCERMGGVQSLFISPHLDDAVLSCGGLIAQESRAQRRAVMLTVFAGVPEDNDVSTEVTRSFLKMCGVGEQEGSVLVNRRRQEDQHASSVVGADCVWLGHPGAVYRHFQYSTQSALFGSVVDDAVFITDLADEVVALWRCTAGALTYLPLGIGNHVDHQICAHLALSLRRAGATVYHYEDLPYAGQIHSISARLQSLCVEGRTGQLEPILESYLSSMGLAPRTTDITDVLATRLAAVDCYVSQLPLLFPPGSHHAAIKNYLGGVSGTAGRYAERVWQSTVPPPPESGRSQKHSVSEHWV